jgi:hypothetical protein
MFKSDQIQNVDISDVQLYGTTYDASFASFVVDNDVTLMDILANRGENRLGRIKFCQV